jgi:hypothetical protein
VRLRPVLLVLVVGTAFAGCTCSHSKQEPTDDSGYRPTSPDGLAAAPLTKAQQSGMTDKEYHDWHQRLQQELCTVAGKKWNQLSGKPELDPGAVHIVTRCTAYGNDAWYKCIVVAETADAFKQCSEKFLRSPE